MALQRALVFIALFLLPTYSCLAADLMDEYLSVPGSYVFVRRSPEGAQPDCLIMTVFEDFMCPACYQASTNLFPPLKAKYGNQLEIRFLGFPFVHQESRLAARAHVIAQGLGLGEEMQKALFQAHFEQHIDITSKEGLAKVADSIGLAPEVLLDQLAGNGGKEELERILVQANSYRVDGTPTIIFDGWIKVNDLSRENLETTIDGLLAKKKTAVGQKATLSPPKSRKAAP
jgi:predicted DsbA family dithiol-disulfide isomerase